MEKIQVSIVTYNSEDCICDCLNSLEPGLQGLEYEVKVVDNNSSDNTVGVINKHFPDVEVISSGENLGFGGGHNLILKHTECPYSLVLNPDAILMERTVSRLLLGLKSDSRMALVGPRVEYEEGWPQISFGLFPGIVSDIRQGRLISSVQQKSPASLRKLENLLEHDVTPAWVSGSCFLAKNEILKEVGYFDDNFFLYLEDVDLCFRLRKLGYQVKVVSNALCRHAEGKSHESSERMKACYRDSRLIFENKHGGWFKFIIYKTLKAKDSKIKFRPELVWKQK